MKMTVDSAMSQLGVKCNIEHWDMGTVSSQPHDILVTTEEFRKNFKDQDNVIFLNNIVDTKEAKEKLEEYLKKHGQL
jgi:PTS system ascorbate-specific IIB component